MLPTGQPATGTCSLSWQLHSAARPQPLHPWPGVGGARGGGREAAPAPGHRRRRRRRAHGGAAHGCGQGAGTRVGCGGAARCCSHPHGMHATAHGCMRPTAAGEPMHMAKVRAGPRLDAYACQRTGPVPGGRPRATCTARLADCRCSQCSSCCCCVTIPLPPCVCRSSRRAQGCYWQTPRCHPLPAATRLCPQAAEGRNAAVDDPVTHALHDALKPEP